MKPGDQVVIIKNLEGAHTLDNQGFLKPGDIITIKSINQNRIIYELNDGNINTISTNCTKPIDKNISWRKVIVKTGEFKEATFPL